ncbi:hypothetical protein BD779DRAFT_1667429 [Infundibulicybe gibba]|nr:hypothetical protein BD779DRAFT_1667429 [Infundibulicybe gibba]
MSFSVLARSAIRHQGVTLRSFHTTTPARSAHGDYHHFPFQMPGDKKAGFGFKVVVYMASGFSLPFLASAWQLKKSGGAA